MIEQLELHRYTDQVTQVVTIEYRPSARPHWNTGRNPSGGRWTAYDVYGGGVLLGRVIQTRESTDRHYGRIRRPGKGRVAWKHQAVTARDESSHYEHTRSTAVARMLGFDYAYRLDGDGNRR